ncbi:MULTISPECIES: hypothetical protein [unclassified Streptomyces]|uniref:hypothetical protein n=1 Tax=unclassified Streptomyces TaxID=2593676 RepID=UPI000BD56B61|nr:MULTISPECIES: hypothetical protein [unclassified Streptomyces]MDN3250575.1 hypothetical protein [Streptomyces sp. ZSW22]MDN3257784.1 hypothetical protein [Streptomyces sp. MA25(2023)]PAK27682.1 hypothetical protein CJD44_02605 [Streptomyces sp. alain-838]
MATEDTTPTYTMVEDEDSVHTDLAERISQFNYFSNHGAAVTALLPAYWRENTSDTATLHEDGSVALDLDGTFELPEPFDRVAPPMMIATTTGMAVLKAGHPANQTIASGFRALNIPVPDVIQALSAGDAALVGDGSCAFRRVWSVRPGGRSRQDAQVCGHLLDRLHAAAGEAPAAIMAASAEGGGIRSVPRPGRAVP